MASLKLSQWSSLTIAANVCGTICVGFGVNAFVNPEASLSMFELTYPTLPAQKALVDNLVMVYGARDIFMGFVVYTASYYNHRQILGSIVLGMGAIACLDGYVCFKEGNGGEWNHWGYAPIAAALGTSLLGVFD